MADPRPKKWRSEDYKAFVRTKKCLYAYNGRKVRCQGKVEAHHIRTGTDGGMGLKPSDCFCVPLCTRHHQIIENHPAWLLEDFVLHRELGFLMAEYVDRMKRRA